MFQRENQSAARKNALFFCFKLGLKRLMMGFVHLLNMGFSADWVLRRKMALFPASVSALLLALFRFFNKFLSSLSKDESFKMNSSCCSMETEALPMKAADSDVSKSDDDSAFEDFDELVTSKPKFVFKFEYQTRERLSRSNQWNASGDYIVSASGIISPENKVEEPEEVTTNSRKSCELNTEERKVSSFDGKEASVHEESTKEESEEVTSRSRSSSKYEFKAGKGVSCFMEEAKVASFTVKEVLGDDFNFSNNGSNSKEASVCEDIPHESADDDYKEEKNFLEKKSVIEDPLSDEEQSGSQEKDSDGEELGSPELQFLSEKDFVASDSDSIGSSQGFSDYFGFLSEKDFGESDELCALEGIDFQNLDIGYEPDGFDEEDEDIMEQLRELEELPVNDHHNPEEVSTKDGKPMDDLVNSVKSNGDDFSANDFEHSNTLEPLWEHQDLIEQLKMELKKVKAIGLPTIQEESESPNMDDLNDLKPWKIDEKSHIGDKMGELHKFYKSYKERMRKFDILNYQKLYAIGFLQSKDSLQTKSSTPGTKSFLFHNFLRCKRKKISDSDPMVKFMSELHSDLEVVYVGQLCLSWEFLQWQYEKAYELWESDPYGICTYNEVAGEFQQFQVLMQRFVENEQYQGPRVENYVKNRCVMRNLLQVPVIRGDILKDRKKTRRKSKDKGVITSDILIEVLEESIRTIWRFIRADRYASRTLVCRKGRREDLSDSDAKLLMEIQTDLQKKEKRLKELMRSEKCILKRFRKHEEEEDEGPEHLYFFSQVDIRLVSRVLNMSSLTTEKLVWCHNKLSRIHFTKRKIRVDPTFLLFPC